MQLERGIKKDIYPRIGRLPIHSVIAADVLATLDRMQASVSMILDGLERLWGRLTSG